jgi:hypothetical protein
MVGSGGQGLESKPSPTEERQSIGLARYWHAAGRPLERWARACGGSRQVAIFSHPDLRSLCLADIPSLAAVGAELEGTFFSKDPKSSQR